MSPASKMHNRRCRFVRIFLRNYRVTMITTLDTSCSENTMVLSARRGFLQCMHVFSSILDTKDISILLATYGYVMGLYLQSYNDSHDIF
jgi:hypothetical protein